MYGVHFITSVAHYFQVLGFNFVHAVERIKMCKDSNCMNVCASWQQWVKALLVLAYVLFVLVALPWLIVYTVKDGLTRKDQLLLIGGIFVLASLPLSIWHILQHALHFTKPILQKPIMRILWMVPIYSSNAVINQIIHKSKPYI